MRKSITAVVLVASAAMLTACTGVDLAQPKTPASVAATQHKGQDKPAPAKAHDPKDDVKITACTVDQYTGWPTAAVTIKNHSSKVSNYSVQVEFVDPKGTRFSEGYAASNNVAPGQKVKEQAAGLAKAPKGVRCRIADVTRYASF